MVLLDIRKKLTKRGETVLFSFDFYPVLACYDSKMVAEKINVYWLTFGRDTKMNSHFFTKTITPVS